MGTHFSKVAFLFQKLMLRPFDFLATRDFSTFCWKYILAKFPPIKQRVKSIGVYSLRVVRKIYEDSLYLIPLPSPLVKILIMGGKVGLRCKGKTLLVLSTIFLSKMFVDSGQQWPRKIKEKKNQIFTIPQR